MRLLTFCICPVFLLPISGLNVRSQDAPTFRAGAFAMDITPTRWPVSVNGGMSDRQATKAHDPLHARCLVLDDGKTKLAIVVCDSCMIPREIFDEAKARASKATGIPTQNMLMSATHTHTAPTVGGVFQSEPDEAYIALLKERIALGVQEAHKRLQPARIGWGVGKDATQVFCRRWKIKDGAAFEDPFGLGTDKVKMNPGYLHPNVSEPAGPVDPEVSFLSVQTADGKPLAFFANYSLHYVGGVPALSADYFAVFAERMKQLLGGDGSFVGCMSNGTSGNVNNINYGGPAPMNRNGEYEQCRIVADSVARAAHAAHKNVTHHSLVTLAAAEQEIELGVRLPNATDVKRAEAILAEAKKPVLGKLSEVYARETVQLAKFPPTVKARLQALRVGDLGIAAVPCEVFSEIGLELKAKSPLKPTFTVSLANGYNGYLPTPEQHALGGYETWRARSSYLEVNASTEITTVLHELLGKVKK
jgi:hypothetical protein